MLSLTDLLLFICFYSSFLSLINNCIKWLCCRHSSLAMATSGECRIPLTGCF